MDFGMFGFVKRAFRMESRLIILEGQYLVRKVLHQRPFFGGANFELLPAHSNIPRTH